MPSPCCWGGCSEVFGHTNELVVHLSAHLGSPQDQCKWRGCAANLGENVTTAVVLRRVVVEHAALRPHRCSQCHKNFFGTEFLGDPYSCNSSEKSGDYRAFAGHPTACHPS
ncbi:unnamed protein product [Bursaphelenchus xylophilus]|uniref:(pine wood nematode) hypothetical protein n=1 Tax=Bursaphelenchus xylophilus TaxID=6326 RepID=A0A1I7RTY2_BURXY|nr:unnamed protein product [Bursaphelenchus xylophilus]CAG9132101.1 unnamed protein product [Bursaphelenchus xylophilus]